jgi:chemotaxis protein methyltransferase CheR
MAPESFQLIAAMVLRETSIIYEERKEYLVEARLHPLAAQAGCANVDEYVRMVTINAPERRKAIDALTINETSWFRDNAPYQAFTETILPTLMANRTTRRHISIWSAACSSGQEAYSLTMLLDQHLPAGWTAEILATDVSTAMLTRVQNGRYSQVEMNRGLPATSLVKYFTRVGTEFEIVPQLREKVRTKHLNLADPAYPGVGVFDFILLRNVLIYFDQPTKHGILRRMHQHLAPDGYLLLGSSETTLDLPPDLNAMWDREQLGRVQAHRPAGSISPRPTTTAALTGA